eukprot:6180267-Alexandrium_andersonii.AAC.1
MRAPTHGAPPESRGHDRSIAHVEHERGRTIHHVKCDRWSPDVADTKTTFPARVLDLLTPLHCLADDRRNPLTPLH